MENEEVKFNNVPSIVMIIVSFLLGGIVGIILAILSLISGSNVATLVAEGKLEEAKAKLKTAKKLLIASYIWDGAVAVLLVLFVVLALVANA